jgi:hypothetical protein
MKFRHFRLGNVAKALSETEQRLEFLRPFLNQLHKLGVCVQLSGNLRLSPRPDLSRAYGNASKVPHQIGTLLNEQPLVFHISTMRMWEQPTPYDSPGSAAKCFRRDPFSPLGRFTIGKLGLDCDHIALKSVHRTIVMNLRSDYPKWDSTHPFVEDEMGGFMST